jgi:hypothetical protein
VDGLVEPNRNQDSLRRVAAFLEDANPPRYGHARINQQVDEAQHKSGQPTEGEAKA